MLHHDLNEVRTRRNKSIFMSRHGDRAAIPFSPIVRGREISRERPIGIFGPDVGQLSDRASQVRVLYCSSLCGKPTASASCRKVLQELLN